MTRAQIFIAFMVVLALVVLGAAVDLLFIGHVLVLHGWVQR